MTPTRRLTVLAACVVVVLLAAWYAAAQFAPPVSPPPTGSVRLGPEPGEDVAGYLARLPAELPPPGVDALALVQFGAELTVPQAVGAAGGTVIDTAVLRVPLTRVQTALRFERLDPGVAPDTALGTARERAQLQAATDAAQAGGRAHGVASAEAAALAEPGCRCVLALVVRSDRTGLGAVMTRPRVRAVEAAPPGTADRELALAPLLPDQTVRADPLPDDGLVPPS
jgi:hypothetical protein